MANPRLQVHRGETADRLFTALQSFLEKARAAAPDAINKGGRFVSVSVFPTLECMVQTGEGEDSTRLFELEGADIPNAVAVGLAAADIVNLLVREPQTEDAQKSRRLLLTGGVRRVVLVIALDEPTMPIMILLLQS